jgi:ankyrin repeat protein
LDGVEDILAKGVDIDSVDENGTTALQVAAANDQVSSL